MSKRRARAETQPTSVGPNVPFPIVGVGASAGGLEALTQLLTELPADTGMAFVLIQHLDPTHPSFLADTLARATKMVVGQAKDGERVVPDHVYVIPPDSDVALRSGILTLVARTTDARKLHLPVDYFLASLAEQLGKQAIGVVLSGTASDGTEGLRAIKREDGITFAQDPKSAKFDGMPRSAVKAGVVDYVLPIPGIARELHRLSRHPYVSGASARPSASDDKVVEEIFALVRTALGVDFGEYKAPSLHRRLARRMALLRIESLRDYLALLRDHPEEAGCLYEEVLIHVTSFFRDPDVFESLKSAVFPEILKTKVPAEPIRFWVAGCSSGEEVYSLAIALLEFLDDSTGGHPIQIFGSDLSERAVQTARKGAYSDAVMRDVSEERRRRFFTKVESGYRINKNVRELCVFVRHDLARDPPFSKLDLVSCRNVLIYFGQALQRRVLPTLHYALRRGGFLFLGRAEGLPGFRQYFSPIDKNNKVFVRTATVSTLHFAPRTEVHPVTSQPNGPPGKTPPLRTVDVARHLDRLLLTRYAPPGVLVDERMQILQFVGDTGRYLRAPPGDPQHNLLKMARGGLLSALRTTVAKAKRERVPVRTKGVEVEFVGGATSATCDVVVVPFAVPPDGKEQLFAVLFEEIAGRRTASKLQRTSRRSMVGAGRRLVPRLERELEATQQYLHSLIDERERTNDDLNAANEELVSGNEELQTMNEELETAKEELQSTNEELTTVNDELNTRNQEVREINSDLMNILSTVDVPILILDGERRIRRFTPKARDILNVLSSDIGRPLDDIKSNLRLDDLDQHISEVIETNQMHESEVQDRNGCWYRMQIRPYKTVDNKIDGATLSLIDIDALKHHVNEAERARGEAERANLAKDEFLATLSHEIRTPLSSMLMHAQLLGRGGLDPVKIKRAADAIERGTRMQVRLVDDLLDVSRIVAGKLTLDQGPVDLCAVVRAAVEGVTGVAEAKGVTFHVVLDETLGPVWGDPTRLQQVVTNLLANAVKFGFENGKVTVLLDRHDGHARLRVGDTGIGIEPEFLPHVFRRFAQEDGTTVRKHGGLVLGLAIVRDLVEAHGGTVRGESEGKGRGSTFSVFLPISDAPSDAPEDTSTSSGSPASKPRPRGTSSRDALRGVRILVVEDDPGSREAVVEMLSVMGAAVRASGSASEAMRDLEEFGPEVLVCDIAMPGEDGYSLIRRVRALDVSRGGGVPAVALTALARVGDWRRAMAAGFQNYLTKPVDIDDLAQAVAELSSPAPAAPAASSD
ncbi:MAG: response regulator [Myxococcaceae bacterium]|nr:MAG: response regulator [Myxococcaceae bacterium]